MRTHTETTVEDYASEHCHGQFDVIIDEVCPKNISQAFSPEMISKCWKEGGVMLTLASSDGMKINAIAVVDEIMGKTDFTKWKTEHKFEFPHSTNDIYAYQKK